MLFVCCLGCLIVWPCFVMCVCVRVFVCGGLAVLCVYGLFTWLIGLVWLLMVCVLDLFVLCCYVCVGCVFVCVLCA